MRLIIGLAGLFVLFALLVRAMPTAWTLPLYLLFVVLTIAFTGWERRRISQRRRQLEQKLHQEKMDLARRQRERQPAGNDRSS
jgi:hypothetical protein